MAEKTPPFWNGWKHRAAALRHVPALMRLVWESGPAVVAAGWVFRITASLIPLAMLSVSKWILDAVQVKTGGGSLPPEFWWLVALEGGLAILGGVLGRTTGFFDGLLADRFTRHVSVRVMEHAAQLDLTSYESPAFHDRLERARAQATDRITMIHAIGALAQQLIIVVSLSVSVLFFSPWLMVVLVLAVVPAFLGESHFAFLGYSLNLSQTPMRRQLDYLRVLGASKETAKELKLFGLGSYITGQYAELSDGLYAQNVALSRRRLAVGSLLSVVSSASYYSAYAYVIYRTVTGDLSWGSLQFIAGSIAGASANIQSIFATFSNIADQSLFLTDLIEFFRVTPTLSKVAHAIPAPRPIRDGFVFEDVSFQYPGNPRPVLEHLDFRISRGERVALVGENGQGKTTLVKLITRLYDPTAGRVLLDGVDLREYDIEDLHREIGVIFQDFVRYEMSARDNIAVGRLHAAGDDWRIRKAAGRSLAHDVISRLPQGYDQLLGRRFEGGVDLSGGEWQKIALARAYLRDAQLLILDEPTAALDARAELEVFQRFAELTAGKMALLISHRFSTVRMADRIVVLSDGHIKEDGHHDSLVAHGGRYARMFELQAASYR
ncbi:Putative multidrug export ATP-binding/permease protein [Luteitalea pratensis]|uniref:Multidrug export ATP-binding/permease protein n=1 Tax=Luteitalea pratensis TaxID=1855912 RepID=A0A143PLU4_LUTPR|nr:Putative multidrug export ATP-binding/permease protein [Luteitalea pratensis]